MPHKINLNITLIAMFVLIAACSTKDLGQSLGFTKAPPDEFLSIELPDIVIPPVIKLSPPAKTVASDIEEETKRILVSQIKRESAAEKTKELAEDIPFIKSLELFDDEPRGTAFRKSFDAQVLGLILLDDKNYSIISAKPGRTIARPVKITFVE